MKRENAAKRCYKKNMIVFIAVFVPLDLLFWLITLPFVNSTVSRFDLFIYPIVLALVGIPFIIYNIVQFVHYSNVRFVNIQRGKVVNSDSHNYGRYGTYVGFLVQIENEIGEKKTVMTKHVHTKADGYFNATVTVGQNPSNGEWIILE